MRYIKQIVAIFSILALIIPSTIFANAKNISQQRAEQIVLENIGAGEITQIRRSRVQGVEVYNITLTYNENNFRFFVNMNGDIIRGRVYITIPEAYEIAINYTGQGRVTNIRYSNFDGIDAYNITVRYQSREYRIIIDSTSGNILNTEVRNPQTRNRRHNL